MFCVSLRSVIVSFSCFVSFWSSFLYCLVVLHFFIVIFCLVFSSFLCFPMCRLLRCRFLCVCMCRGQGFTHLATSSTHSPAHDNLIQPQFKNSSPPPISLLKVFTVSVIKPQKLNDFYVFTMIVVNILLTLAHRIFSSLCEFFCV